MLLAKELDKLTQNEGSDERLKAQVLFLANSKKLCLKCETRSAAI